jgi:hypothetical protein
VFCHVKKLRNGDTLYTYDDIIQETNYWVVTSFNPIMLTEEVIYFIEAFPFRTCQCNGAIDRPGVGRRGPQTCPAHPIEF